ncbi:MAG: recombinase family protein [Acidimicrobiales bacterium]
MTRHPIPNPTAPGYRQPAVRVAAYTRVVVLDRRRPSNLDHRQAHLAAFVAAQPAWHLVAGYADIGPGQLDRPGLGRLLADARAARFDLIVVDDSDRLSRDPQQLAWIAGQLAAAGVGVLPLGAPARHRGAAMLTSVMISDYLRG